MTTALVISQVLTWIVLILLVGMGFALLRQIGVLHERISPLGAMMSDKGPDIGELAPSMKARDLDGREVQIGGPDNDGRSTLIFFVAASCPMCKRLLPVAKQFAQEERYRVILVGDGERDAYQSMVREHGLEDLPLVNSPSVGMRYHVGKLPYAVLLDETGVIRSKGLVNTREHLESLAVAKEMGVTSIQEYLAAARRAEAGEAEGAGEPKRVSPEEAGVSGG